MKSIGIICEYHPFHLGHAHQLNVLRKRYPEAVLIAVMSGAFVQRGEPAMGTASARAEAAVCGGADLVLSLPFPYSMAPAELFARAGVSILSAAGAEGLCFGTEGEVLPALLSAAERLDSPLFQEAMQNACRDRAHAGIGYPQLRGMVYDTLYGTDAGAVLRQPNNLLGIEYLRACRALGVSPAPIAVPRVGDGHDSAPESGIVSASAIRSMLRNGETAERYLPQTTWDILRREADQGHLFWEEEKAAALLLWHYRSNSSASLSSCAGLGGGLAGRLCASAREAVALDGFFRLAETKKYTRAAIRRAAWYGFFGVREETLRTCPPVTEVLAADARGMAWLRTHGKPEHCTILTRPAAGKRLSLPTRAAWEQMTAAEAVQGMLFSAPLSAAELLRRGSPFLLH